MGQAARSALWAGDQTSRAAATPPLSLTVTSPERQSSGPLARQPLVQDSRNRSHRRGRVGGGRGGVTAWSRRQRSSPALYGTSLLPRSFAHSLCAGTRDEKGCWGHQRRGGQSSGRTRASAGHRPGPRPARRRRSGDPGGGAGVKAPPGLFPGEGVGMLSHGSVTASHLSPALGG